MEPTQDWKSTILQLKKPHKTMTMDKEDHAGGGRHRALSWT